MAKGRKLTISRSERYLESFSYGHGQGPVTGEEEFGEEDVWSMVDEGGGDRVAGGDWGRRHVSGGGGEDRNVGGLSLAFDDHTAKTPSSRIIHQYRGHDSVAALPRGRHIATSAPMNVPDWSKIYRVDSSESLHDSDNGVDDCDDSEIVPPHEYLARSRKKAANSVFEGVGRTLKGRDMSRVRDAVWSRTGFDG